MSDESKHTETKDPRVEAAIREYLEQVDRGELVDLEEFISRHAEIANALRSFVAADIRLRRIAPTEIADASAEVSTRSFTAHGQETIPPKSNANRSPATARDGLQGQFGRYQIIRALGKGAMGAVYLALDTQLKRNVAIKTPHFEDDPTGELLKRFYREAEAAATLRHANICPVYDVGQIDGKHFISMAYIEGRPLSDVIRSSKAQNERQIVIAVQKLARALQEAHDHGIVHRDLKPANIMVDKKGEPIIMDFGLARKARKEGEATLTQSGAILGSPAYMSPEQIEGDPDSVGPASDQYNLGVVLYEMLTGQLPFRGSVVNVLAQIITKGPTTPSELRAGLDPRIEAVCLRMMAKKASNRFPSTKAVADQLAAIVKNPAAAPIAGEKSPAAPGPSREGPGASQNRKPKKEKVLTESDVTSLEELVRKCLRRRDYDQMIQIIERVPEDRRSESLQTLLEKAREKADLISFLICEIDEADRLGDGRTALKKAEELLTIKPRHHRAREIQEKYSGYGQGGAARIGLASQFTKPWSEGGWIPWSALAFGVAVFAAMCGVIVIYLNKTAIVVDVKDPDIIVAVKGTTVTVTGPDHQSVKVEPGDQELKITSAGFETTARSFSLKKGDKKTVTVSIVNKEIVARLENEILPLTPVRDDSASSQTAGGNKPLVPQAPADGEKASSPAVPAQLPRVATVPAPADALRREQISPYELAVAGGGDPEKAPPELVAILGDSRLNHWAHFALTWIGARALSYSRDGKTLATASVDGTANLWETDTGNLLRSFEGHEGPVRALDLSPDGMALATGGEDRTVKLWDARSGRLRMSLEKQSGGISCLAFSPDGRLLVGAVVNGPAQVVIWAAATGRSQRVISVPDDLFGVVFSPDGKTVAAGGGRWWGSAEGRGWVRLFNLDTGIERRVLMGHRELVTSVAFSPDGKTLASTSWDFTARLWDLATGQEIRKLQHSNRVLNASFSPDGKMLATSNDGDNTRFWEVATGKLQGVLDRQAQAVAFSPDGRTLASGAGDHTLRLWDVATRRELAVSSAHSHSVNHLAISPDGMTLACGGDDRSVSLWDVAAGRKRRELEGHRGNLIGHDRRVTTATAFGPVGSALASGGRDGTILLWNAATGTKLKALTGHKDEVTALSFSRDGRTLASASTDKTVRLWDLANGGEAWRPLEGHSVGVRSVAFSPNGRILASGGDDKSVKLWDPATGQLRKTLDGHEASVRSVCFTPDGQTLISAGADKTVRLWDLTKNQARAILEGHTAAVTSVAVSPDGQMLASAGEDGTVRLRDAGSGGLRQLLKLGPSGGCINGVVFTPDGRHLATANGNGTVYILRLAARASSPVPPQSIAQLPTDENKTHGSAPTATSDLDRPAAKAMLALGGMVAVRVNGQVREISASGGLPAETLELVRVTLSSADLQDEQLKPLRGLTNLIAIRLDGSRNVTNAALEHFRGMSQLESLEVVGTKIGDAGLARLGPLGLSHLLHVNLAGTLVSDAGMEHIAILENVRGLGLAYRPITDAGYRHLVNLKELRALLINDTRITDHGLPYLQQLPNLVTLSLSGTLVTEAGLAHLREFKQLNFLDLSDTRIRGPSLAQLRPLSELRFLGLYGLNVANSDLVHLTAFAQLDRVGLGRTRVTDLGLKTLKALTKLRYLDVGDTQVTQSAADELRKSLPECEIIVNTVSRPKKAGRTRRP